MCYELHNKCLNEKCKAGQDDENGKDTRAQELLRMTFFPWDKASPRQSIFCLPPRKVLCSEKIRGKCVPPAMEASHLNPLSTNLLSSKRTPHPRLERLLEVARGSSRRRLPSNRTLCQSQPLRLLKTCIARLSKIAPRKVESTLVLTCRSRHCGNNGATASQQSPTTVATRDMTWH